MSFRLIGLEADLRHATQRRDEAEAYQKIRRHVAGRREQSRNRQAAYYWRKRTAQLESEVGRLRELDNERNATPLHSGC